MGDYNLNQSMNSPDGAKKETRREVKITIFTAKVVSGGLVRRRNQIRYFAFFLLEGHLMSISPCLQQGERKSLNLQYAHQFNKKFLNLKEEPPPFFCLGVRAI